MKKMEELKNYTEAMMGIFEIFFDFSDSSYFSYNDPMIEWVLSVLILQANLYATRLGELFTIFMIILGFKSWLRVYKREID